MWETRDPDGRTVVLTRESWEHIIDGHPYIGVGPEEIVDIVARPNRSTRGPMVDEEWFYRRGIGPSAWIRVVVHFEQGHGLIVTAFPRRRFP